MDEIVFNGKGIESEDENKQVLSDQRISQTLEELYEKMILGTGGTKEFKELDTYIPTGFCDLEEIDLLRGYQHLLTCIEYLEKRIKKVYGIEIEFKKLKDFLLRKMFFLTLSSKSKNGFGIKAVQTQRQIFDQYPPMRPEPEEDEDFLDSLKEKLGGSVGNLRKGLKGRTILPKKKLWR